MVFHVLTIFEEFFEGPFGCGVIARTKKAGRIEIRFHDLRDYTSDVHRTVDDRPFGGDEGMVLKVEPICLAIEKIRAGWGAAAGKAASGEKAAKKTSTVVLSAQGRRFDQSVAARLAACDEVVLICGRYEGIDERVVEHLADEEISIRNWTTNSPRACGMGSRVWRPSLITYGSVSMTKVRLLKPGVWKRLVSKSLKSWPKSRPQNWSTNVNWT